MQPRCLRTCTAQVEDLADENAVLRKRAGVSEEDKVDTKDVRMQKEATIAQLRSLNALLERQVRVTARIEWLPRHTGTVGVVILVSFVV